VTLAHSRFDPERRSQIVFEGQYSGNFFQTGQSHVDLEQAVFLEGPHAVGARAASRISVGLPAARITLATVSSNRGIS